MKDRKLLIPVRCTTRKFHLHHPPPGRNDWHVRFWPPPGSGVKRVVFRTTGTKEIAAAKKIAAQIIESFWNDAGRGAETLKLRNDSATLGNPLMPLRDFEEIDILFQSLWHGLRLEIGVIDEEGTFCEPPSALNLQLNR